jgi:hypothetical protein
MARQCYASFRNISLLEACEQLKSLWTFLKLMENTWWCMCSAFPLTGLPVHPCTNDSQVVGHLCTLCSLHLIYVTDIMQILTAFQCVVKYKSMKIYTTVTTRIISVLYIIRISSSHYWFLHVLSSLCFVILTSYPLVNHVIWHIFNFFVPNTSVFCCRIVFHYSGS